MFVHCIKDNRGKKNGYYCTLVNSVRVNGKPVHETVMSFGYIPVERVPYLKATFNSGEPGVILANELRRQESEGR
jgi:hypothetical protein